MQTLHEHLKVFKFSRNGLIFGVHVKTAFALASTVHFHVWILFDFKDFFPCMWLKIRDKIRTPNVKWSPNVVRTFWDENLWRCLTIELLPSGGSHKHSTHFPCDFDGSNVILQGIKHGILLCIASFN